MGYIGPPELERTGLLLSGNEYGAICGACSLEQRKVRRAMPEGHVWRLRRKIESFMSFGRMPIANGFLSKADLAHEYFLRPPLFCKGCGIFRC